MKDNIDYRDDVNETDCQREENGIQINIEGGEACVGQKRKL